jgi:alpha-beta hydrolase superfamily lysophospholipase
VPHTQRTLKVSDGTPINLERWTPDGPVRFVTVIAHGGAEHVGRFDRLARMLNEHGGLVFGPDHRGQGSSGGRPGHIDRFETYAGDLREVIRQEAAELSDDQQPDAIPWFLFGHSMGGLISLVLLLHHPLPVPLRGAIISSPLLGLTMKVNPVKLAVGKIAARLLPKLSLPSGIPASAICRDPEEVRRYEDDERRADVVSASWFAAMNDAIVRVEAEISRIELPMLWYVGTGDLICDHRATERVFAGLPAPEERDQTLRRFEGYYHELHNEPEADRKPVFDMITEWIETRLQPRDDHSRIST